MKTPEEYAKRFFGDHDHWIRIPACMEDGTVFEAMFQSMQFGDRAGEIVSGCRATLAALIRRAIEDAHAAWMASVSGGISEDRLKEVARVVASDKGWYDRFFVQMAVRASLGEARSMRAYEDRRDLLAHIQHQAALIEDIAQLSSEYTEARERIRKEARREGWLECKIACLENAKAFCQQVTDDEGILCDDVERLLDSILSVPDSPP